MKSVWYAIGFGALVMIGLGWGLGMTGDGGAASGTASVPRNAMDLRRDEGSATLAPVLARSARSTPARPVRDVRRSRAARKRMPSGRKFSGQVIDAESRAGIEGVTVSISRGSHAEEFFRVRTDQAGKYRLEALPGGWLEIEVPYGWDTSQRALRCTEDAQSTCENVVFELTRVEVGPVHGRVVDAVTGEPVPGYIVDLRALERHEVVTTDESGSFHTTSDYPLGRVLAFLRSGPECSPRRVWIEHELNGSVAEIAFSVGPTYPVSFRLPASLRIGDFRAYLRSRGSALAPPGLGQTDAVREGAPWWVRIPRAQLGMDELELCLFSSTGRWSGTVPVEANYGIERDVHYVELTQGGGLVIEVSTPDGQPAGNVAFSFLHEAQGRVPRPSRQAQMGRFEWSVLSPGTYDVRVRQRGFGSVLQRVVVAPGRLTVERVTLGPKEELSVLAGIVRFRSGTVADSLSVLLTAPDGRLQSARIEEDPDVPGQGRFRIENLIVQPYELRISDGNFASVPASVTVRLPNENLVFDVLDNVPTAELVLRVVGDAPDEIVEQFTVSYSIDGASPRSLSTFHARQVSLGPVPREAMLSWTVAAPKRTPVSGDHTWFEDEGGAPGALVATVVLRQEP